MHKAISLVYHDVVERGALDASGYKGAGPNHYKLDREEFQNHLNEIKSYALVSPSLVTNATSSASDLRLYLTFDDGGVSAYSHIAGMLEDFGWRGHFFLVTDLLGKHGFLSAEQVRDLSEKGHVIGSHSHTHPKRLSKLPYKDILNEWKKSVNILSDITGKAVISAGIPGGFFSRQVGEAAITLGISELFISNPGMDVQPFQDGRVYERLCLFRGSPPEKVRRYVQADRGLILREKVFWQAKGMLKKAMGDPYLRVREFVLKRVIK